ncbi:MAG: DUF6691 family protein [Burkholderiales bacterium]
MKAYASAFGAGLVFGAGLWLSGMADPRRVLGFLDVAGRWDPTLLFVMAGALAVAFIAFRGTARREKPLLTPRFVMPSRRSIDAPLVVGSAIFGLGWGIAGYCPGPAITALSNGTPEIFVLFAAMVAGGWLHHLFEHRGLPAAAENT